MSTRQLLSSKSAAVTSPSFTPVRSGLLQRKCVCCGTPGPTGESEACKKKQRLGLQTKLKINEPGDIYEQEADRIADQVLATPAHYAVSGAPQRIQRLRPSNGQIDAAPASVDHVLASPGKPLKPALRQDMKQRFGHDFSRVRVHADTQAAVAQRRAAPAAVTRLSPSQVPLRMTPTGDRTEAQARRFASTGKWATPVTPGRTYSISGYGVRALEHGVAGPGSPLDAQTRRRFEPELRLDLAPVRVHTDATAAASARALGAKAYTVGSHIVFAPGRYQAATDGGRELLAHELAHVAQQAASGAPVVAAFPDISIWDVGELVFPTETLVVKAVDRIHPGIALDALEAGARYILGDTLFALLQSFVRGFKDGLEHAPSRQVDAISDRFHNFGFQDAFELADGFTNGVINGLWQALQNLGKALLTLLELPLKIQKFLMDLPHLAQRYAPRIAQLVTEGNRLLNRLGEAFARDPAGSMAQLDRLLKEARTFVLGKVWNRGREAAKDVLGFLEKSWDYIGEFFGNITGQILFEVLLAVGTELIGNIVKETALLIGRVATRAVEAIEAIGGLIGQVLKWLEGLVGRFVGNTGEVLVAIRDWLRTLLKVFDEMAPEMEGAVVGPKGTGVTVPVPKPTVIESRVVRQPGSPTVADITPPKVHPSNVPKKTEPPKPTVSTEPPKPAAPKEPAVPTEPIPAAPAVPLSPEEQRLQVLGDNLEKAKEQLNTANQRLKELEKQGKDKFSREHREQQRKFTEATDEYSKARNRLEAERRTQGISSRQLYERLRGRTPNAQMDQVAAMTQGPYGPGVSPDHIVPVIDIVEMPGFERLPPKMQTEVLNIPENTSGLDPRVNLSKGDKLWSAKPGTSRYWEGHPDFGPIPTEARQVMVQAEARARAALEKAIKERLQKLGL